jgi:hypothetical protein
MSAIEPHRAPTVEERLEAMEFLLGQALLLTEAESVTVRARLARLERAVRRTAPGAIHEPGPDDDDFDMAAMAFTLASLGDWMQTCLSRMRQTHSVSAQQMVAIGQTTDRVLGLGSSLREDSPPPIEPAVRAALDRVRRRRPSA